jgi:DNA-binding MarR family transcriptional regulator
LAPLKNVFHAVSKRFGYALWQTEHAVARAFDEALHALDIGLTQTATLMHLQRQPGMTGAELSRKLLITPQSTATLLRQIESRGWITRHPHPTHRNVVEARLTGAGRRMLDRAVAIMDEVDARIVKGLNPGERTALEDALAHCRKNALDLHTEVLEQRRRR